MAHIIYNKNVLGFVKKYYLLLAIFGSLLYYCAHILIPGDCYLPQWGGGSNYSTNKFCIVIYFVYILYISYFLKKQNCFSGEKIFLFILISILSMFMAIVALTDINNERYNQCRQHGSIELGDKYYNFFNKIFW